MSGCQVLCGCCILCQCKVFCGHQNSLWGWIFFLDVEFGIDIGLCVEVEFCVGGKFG